LKYIATLYKSHQKKEVKSVKKNPGRKERRRMIRFMRIEEKKQATKLHNNILMIAAKKRRKPVFKVRLIRLLTGRDIITGRNITQII
jgi:hypothetical protein